MHIFCEKKKFMHTMFSATFQTDRVKKFFRKHEDDFYAQMVYKKFYGFHSTSVGSRFSVSGMLSYITSANFDSRKGTPEYFILNWKDQVWLCESLVISDSYFYENEKKN